MSKWEWANRFVPFILALDAFLLLALLWPYI